MVCRSAISARLVGSLARMCRAPVQPSTISSIRTPSWRGGEMAEVDVKTTPTSSKLPPFQRSPTRTWYVCWVDEPCFWASWWALSSRLTRRGMAPAFLRGAWFSGQSARLRIRPTTACRRRGGRTECQTRSRRSSPLFTFHLKSAFRLAANNLIFCSSGLVLSSEQTQAT